MHILYVSLCALYKYNNGYFNTNCKRQLLLLSIYFLNVRLGLSQQRDRSAFLLNTILENKGYTRRKINADAKSHLSLAIRIARVASMYAGSVEPCTASINCYFYLF